MKIEHPLIGPIVGYTAADHVRIWQRGKLEQTQSGYRRSFGVVQVREDGAAAWSKAIYTKMPPYFDMTGVMVVSGLVADTTYQYRVGWFFAESEIESFTSGEVQESVLQWENAYVGSFRTASARNDQARSYTLGSCRYLMRLFGGSIWDERGDKAFRSIGAQIDAGRQTDGLFMIGDQIYADDLNFLAPDTRLDQFLDRYRAAFGQEHLRNLMARVPTYMILDDHEIEDNWPMKADDKDWLTIYPAAIHAYQIYQCSHSPLFKLDAEGQITGSLTRLWYNFQDGCCDCFFMDARTERVWSKDDPRRRRMISDHQMESLLAWLSDGSGRVKLVVSSVPFFPDLKAENDDKWGGFLPERTMILDHILAEKVRKVVFLAGDVHCSFSVELTSPADLDFKVVSVVSSAFFWPYPHMDDGDFFLTGPLRSTANNVYHIGNASAVHSDDNFVRLDVTPGSVSVLVYERKGRLLGQKTHAF